MGIARRMKVSMSFRTLHLGNDLPPFFSFTKAGKLAGSGLLMNDGEIETLKQQLKNLREEGICAVISLTEDPLNVEVLKEFGVLYLHLPTNDLTPPKLQDLCSGCSFIDDVDGAVLVHCKEGIGRTGTLLAAYEVWNGATAAEAVEAVRNMRYGSIHKKCQEQQLYRFAKVLGDPSVSTDSIVDGSFDSVTYDFSDCLLDEGSFRMMPPPLSQASPPQAEKCPDDPIFGEKVLSPSSPLSSPGGSEPPSFSTAA